MNKIKASVAPNHCFSPWEESFINLVQRFDAPLKKTKLKNQYITLEASKAHTHTHNKAQVSKRELGRSTLNLSKINLRSPSEREQQSLQPRSTRYQGPRITFYSKMNPNCSQDKHSGTHRHPRLTLRHSFQQPLDQSISYLRLLEEEKPRQTYVYYGFILANRGDNDYFYRRRKEGDQSMKRLKMLWDNRRLKQDQR